MGVPLPLPIKASSASWKTPPFWVQLAHYNAPGQIPFSFKKLQDTFHGNIPRCFSRIATFRPTPSSGLPFSSIAKCASSCTHVPLRLPWAQRIHFTQNHLRNGCPPPPQKKKLTNVPQTSDHFFKKNPLPTINFPSVC